MIRITNESQCCGCAACYNICPTKCIRMKKNSEGFSYPEVDVQQCLNCRKCEKACPMINGQVNTSNEVKASYSVVSLNMKERLQSSSGGVFSVLAKEVISNGGSVYGVAMSMDCRTAEHTRVNTVDSLSILRGSKYLQAQPNETYSEVKRDLNQGLPVLFSGTMCQVNGLKGYLGHDYENLITVDVVCHGVPSQALWEKYVNYEERRHNGVITAVNFRHKKKGWQNFGIEKIEGGKRIWSSIEKDPYMHMFLNNYCLRPSCYKCLAKKIKQSDISLADFWGVDSFTPEMNDGKGTSLVLIRTEKGKRLFASIESKIKFKQITYEQAVAHNPAEYASAKRPHERESFFKDMNSMEFNELANRYYKPKKMGMIKKIKQRVSSTALWRKIRVLKTRRGG